MTGIGTTSAAVRRSRRQRRGLAGLFIALFLVGGLVFSYGLGHAPALRLCTAHDTGIPSAPTAPALPAGSASASGTASAPGATADATGHPAVLRDLPAHLVPRAWAVLDAPVDRAPLVPAHACLCLAVLLSLMVLALAAPFRRTLLRLPPRLGWLAGPPLGTVAAPPSLSALQVLRL
ncbi:hypothetical protein ACQEU3_01470 [Spirillospora sp. CA-253888]